MGYTRGQFNNSKFMKSADLALPGGGWGTKVVTITAARDHTFPDKTKQLVLSFQGEAKEWGFSASEVWNAMESIMGSGDSDHWIGKQIELYVDPSVKYMGKPTPAIRPRAVGVRAAAPQSVPSAPPPAAPPPAAPAPSGGVTTRDGAWEEWVHAYGDKPVDTAAWYKAIKQIGPNEAAFTAANWLTLSQMAPGGSLGDKIPF